MAKTNFTQRTWILLGIFAVTATVGIVILSSESLRQDKVKLPYQVLREESDGVAPTKGATANQAQTYTKLTVEYKDRRIQFDMNCQAIPNNITYKNGTKVMFDNRSGDARIITVGGVKYNFAGYGYKILTLSSNTLPKTLLISCGAAVNVGQILLQR